MNATTVEQNPAQYRLTLTKSGKSQASVRMDFDGIKRSGLSSPDRYRVELLRKGETYTDADGDRWMRTN